MVEDADGGDKAGEDDFLIHIECLTVEMFHWSLHEIDETDIESLIPFVFEYPKWKNERGVSGKRKMLFADEADFLM